MERNPKPVLRVALLQTFPAWGQAEANCAAAERLLRPLMEAPAAERPDLVVLPEMFATGFGLPLEEALQAGDTVRRWMQTLAAQSGAAVVGTTATRDGAARAVNRLWWVRPDGSESHYDKRHLFGLGTEKRDYAPGAPHEPVEIAGWRVMPNICYDLRFPDYCRNRLVRAASAVDYAYDVALFPASWPTARIAHWRLLLQARAVENMAYALGVNRVGEDAHGLSHGGCSMAVSPKGRVLWQGDDGESAVCVALDWQALATYRKKFPVAEDWAE